MKPSQGPPDQGVQSQEAQALRPAQNGPKPPCQANANELKPAHKSVALFQTGADETVAPRPGPGLANITDSLSVTEHWTSC